MKKVKQISDIVVMTEILNAIVYEKSELVWVVPYSAIVQEKVVQELFTKYPVSVN